MVKPLQLLQNPFLLTFEIFRFLNISDTLFLIILQMIHKTHACHSSHELAANLGAYQGKYQQTLFANMILRDKKIY